MSKILLFYSNYCQFSKKLIDEIDKKGIKNEFLMISIDTNKYKIPAFVNKVPMLFSKETNKVYVEEEIVDYINFLLNKKNKNDEDVQYYSEIEMDNKFSDNFSFLNDEYQKKSFVFVNEDNNFNNNIIGNTIQNNNKDDSQSNKLDSATIEKYMMQRDADFNSAMQSMQRR